MIEGQEMNMALGLPIYITGFNDGKTRKCYPYKLKDIYKLHSYMEFINQDDFVSNLKSEDSLVCIKFLLEESFPETLEDEGENEILRYLDGSNFKEIIHDIEIVNGIGSDSRVTTESMDNGDKESIDSKLNDVQVLTDHYTYSGYYTFLNSSFWKSLFDCIFWEDITGSEFSKSDFKNIPSHFYLT